MGFWTAKLRKIECADRAALRVDFMGARTVEWNVMAWTSSLPIEGAGSVGFVKENEGKRERMSKEGVGYRMSCDEAPWGY